jgi:hypothetical protein
MSHVNLNAAKLAMKHFNEESSDLVLMSMAVIQAASDLFKQEGNYAAANDILARYDDYQEELAYLIAELV